MRRFALVGGSVSLALVFGAPALMFWVSKTVASGPPLNVCGNSRNGQEFVGIALLLLVVGFAGAVVSLILGLRQRATLLIAPVAAIVTSPASLVALLMTAMLTYGFEC